MLYARILRPPAHRAQLKNIDTSAAEKMMDVQVVHESDMIAALHPTPDGAAEALAIIHAQFDIPEEDLDQTNIYEHLLNAASNKDVIEQKGNLEEGKWRYLNPQEVKMLKS